MSKTIYRTPPLLIFIVEKGEFCILAVKTQYARHRITGEEGVKK